MRLPEHPLSLAIKYAYIKLILLGDVRYATASTARAPHAYKSVWSKYPNAPTTSAPRANLHHDSTNAWQRHGAKHVGSCVW